LVFKKLPANWLAPGLVTLSHWLDWIVKSAAASNSESEIPFASAAVTASGMNLSYNFIFSTL
jgi:hypothetical protein